jgi:hypothetical protein
MMDSVTTLYSTEQLYVVCVVVGLIMMYWITKGK